MLIRFMQLAVHKGIGGENTFKTLQLGGETQLHK